MRSSFHFSVSWTLRRCFLISIEAVCLRTAELNGVTSLSARFADGVLGCVVFTTALDPVPRLNRGSSPQCGRSIEPCRTLLRALIGPGTFPSSASSLWLGTDPWPCNLCHSSIVVSMVRLLDGHSEGFHLWINFKLSPDLACFFIRFGSNAILSFFTLALDFLSRGFRCWSLRLVRLEYDMLGV